jgi:hypothetical protein
MERLAVMDRPGLDSGRPKNDVSLVQIPGSKMPI